MNFSVSFLSSLYVFCIIEIWKKSRNLQIRETFHGVNLIFPKCEEKYRSRLLGNIVLTGGNSLISGLDKRIETELTKLLPDKVSVKVNAQKGRDNFTWKGGVHLCSLSSFQGLWLTKQDYMETGTNDKNNDANETSMVTEVL